MDWRSLDNLKNSLSVRPDGANPFDMAVEVNPRNAEQFLSMAYYGHA